MFVYVMENTRTSGKIFLNITREL